MKILCDIYKSTVEDDMYLYVPKNKGLSGAPQTLLDMFGKPRHVLTTILQPNKKLARADITKVLESLEKQGFYLQMPAQKETYMQEINTRNSKL